MKKESIEKTFTIINSNNNIHNLYNNFILLIDYQNMYIDLKQSYNNNNDKVYQQFIRDYNRCKIYINNIRENNYKTFIEYFELLCISNNYNIYDLYLFCTQAIMGYCLQIIYNKLFDDLYIGEEQQSKPLIYNYYKCKKTIKNFFYY